jgi:hypothetical protein
MSGVSAASTARSIAPHTTIDALLAGLAGDDPLHAPLPGTTLSVYDGLTHCL